jgi:hypothetical protein
MENTEKREEFIARIKNADKQSKPFLNLQTAMTEVKMHKTPRAIDQKIIIQHTLRFSEIEECFQNFRLVCKSWKDAVETIRINRNVRASFFYDLEEKIEEGIYLNTYYLGKYLKLFRKIYMPLNLENNNKIFSLVLNNMKGLNKIFFVCGGVILGEEYDSFVFQMLQNSHETLRDLKLPKLVIPDIGFPHLTKLYLTIEEDNILLQDFQTNFPQALKNMENLEIIIMGLFPSWQSVGEYICENYSKQCISAHDPEALDIMPVKLLEGIDDLRTLENKKYISHMQCAHINIYPDGSMSNGWDRYREIFDKCINLKEIELQGWNDNVVTETLPNMSDDDQEIWNERISYFQSRGIRITNPNEIQRNENLRNKLAKEAGVTWRFHFW